MVFVFENGKQDTMQWASIETKISSKVEEKEIAPTGPESVYGREGGKFNKRKYHKNEFKCSNISFMHNHTLHDRLHQIYVFLSKTGMQSKKKEGLAPDKSFRKIFRRKKVIQTN